jgi:myo-inositol-1(or 4)-monophosphatase
MQSFYSKLMHRFFNKMTMSIPNHVASLGCEDLIIAAEAALAGGQVLLKYWTSPPKEYMFKADSHYDLVSEVDVNSDRAVQAVLKQEKPGDYILSEELNPDTDIKNAKCGRLWIIDPLDGTSAFLFNTDPTAPSVMIALMVDGVTNVAVVFQPMIHQWTYAVRGKGAFVNGEQVKVTDSIGTITDSWIDMNHYGDSAYESGTFKSIDKMLRGKGGSRLVSRASPYSAIAIRLLRPVGGAPVRGLSACVHDHNSLKPKQLPWDIAPIQLIIEEAGGVYVDSSKGFSSPLDPFDLKGPIVVGNESIVSYILDRIKSDL